MHLSLALQEFVNIKLRGPWQKTTPLFKESALWVDSLYESKCPYVCLSVCPSHFLTPFNSILPPLPKVQCPNFLDFRNTWGKVMERNGLRFENFCS